VETIQHQMPSSTSNPRTFTSREFSHKASSAKRAADFGPVFITDRGQAKHVLLSITDYQKLSKQHVRLSDLLACDDGDFDFEQYLPRFRDYPREVDFS
jgi:Antitoxin Phd_YefM, type II toxin-antitoxin system